LSLFIKRHLAKVTFARCRVKGKGVKGKGVLSFPFNLSPILSQHFWVGRPLEALLFFFDENGVFSWYKVGNIEPQKVNVEPQKVKVEPQKVNVEPQKVKIQILLIGI
jgi:hypothetical protein